MIATHRRPRDEEAAAGRGSLRVVEVAGASALSGLRAAAPLKLLVPRPRGRAVWAYAASLGGGLVDGDCLELDLELGAGSTALVATQASTKVYRGSAEQHLRARVGEGALLALVPDPICCFRDASFFQTQELALEPGGSLVLLEAIVAGRVARGERWAFASYRSRTRVRAGGRLALVESLALEDHPGALPLGERMGARDALALIALLGPRTAPLAARLLDEIGARPARPGPLEVCASPIAGGAVVRVAGERIDQVAAWLRGALAGLADELGEDPFARRY